MMRSGPHHTRIAKRELRQVLTEVRRLWGQPSIGPSTVPDQSMERIRAPSSPPPERKSRVNCVDSMPMVATISPSGFPVTIRQPGSTSKLRLYFHLGHG